MPSRKPVSISDCATLLPSPIKVSLSPCRQGDSEMFSDRLHVGERLQG
jgi:hypothetical protein